MRLDCENSKGCKESCTRCRKFKSIYHPVDFKWMDYRELRLQPELKNEQGRLT